MSASGRSWAALARKNKRPAEASGSLGSYAAITVVTTDRHQKANYSPFCPHPSFSPTFLTLLKRSLDTLSTTISMREAKQRLGQNVANLLHIIGSHDMHTIGARHFTFSLSLLR